MGKILFYMHQLSSRCAHAMVETLRRAEVFNYLCSSSYTTGANKNIKKGIGQRAALFDPKERTLFLKGTKGSGFLVKRTKTKSSSLAMMIAYITLHVHVC